MNKLLLAPALLATALYQTADATNFEFVKTVQTIYYGEQLDTSIRYTLQDEGDGTGSEFFTSDFINTTRMMFMTGQGKLIHTLFGWSIQGIPSAYEYWIIDGPGRYKIQLDVELEHSPVSPPQCNKSSPCYIPHEDSVIETFRHHMLITVLPAQNMVEVPPEAIAPDKPPVVDELPKPYVPPVKDVPPFETEEVILDTGETVNVMLDPISVVEEVAQEAEAPKESSSEVAADSSGALSWLLALPLLLLRGRKIS